MDSGFSTLPLASNLEKERDGHSEKKKKMASRKKVGKRLQNNLTVKTSNRSFRIDFDWNVRCECTEKVVSNLDEEQSSGELLREETKITLVWREWGEEQRQTEKNKMEKERERMC